MKRKIFKILKLNRQIKIKNEELDAANDALDAMSPEE